MSDPTQLISGYFDATLTDQEVDQLDALLRADPAQALLFVRLAILHSAIRDNADVERSLSDLPAALAQDTPDQSADPAATLRGLVTSLPEEMPDQTIPSPDPAAPIPLKKARQFPGGNFGRRTAPGRCHIVALRDRADLAVQPRRNFRRSVRAAGHERIAGRDMGRSQLDSRRWKPRQDWRAAVA